MCLPSLIKYLNKGILYNPGVKIFTWLDEYHTQINDVFGDHVKNR